MSAAEHLAYCAALKGGACDCENDDMGHLARVLAILERHGVTLVPVKDDGTPETSH